MTAVDRLLRQTAVALDGAGLAPCIDWTMERVLAECPVCFAGVWDLSPIGFRPLSVACHGGPPVRLQCHTGCEPTAIAAAVDRPVDWQRLALTYRDALACLVLLTRQIAVLARPEATS